MDMKKVLIKFLGITVLITFISCSATVTEKTDAIIRESDRSLTTNKSSDSISVDSNQVTKKVLTSMYVKAIQDYIDAIYRKDKSSFDTLYLANRKMGGPDDFPDIELPEKIEGVEIILMPFVDAHANKIIQYKKTTPLINLMGWVDKVKGEFVFVTFFPGFKHNYDCYINYNFNSEKKDYELEKLTIEVLVMDKNGKSDHYAIFQEGKHIGNRPLDENKK